MRILGHRHTGIIVNDFDKMLNFYIGLGFELRRRDKESGEFVNHLLNSVDSVYDTAKLVLPDKKIPIHNRFNLELLKLVDNNKVEIDSHKFNKFDFNERSIGVLDIAFTVDDIKSV
jgi:catechol 2,3-dioxygenase-like lactoylglutathione lyase family enzyme